MLGVVDGLDDVLVVPGEVEEAAALSRRAEFRKNVFAGQRHEIVCGVKSEEGTQVPKYPGRVVLKLEIILRRGNKFVAGTVMGSVQEEAKGEWSSEHTYRTSTFVSPESQHL